MSGLHNVVWRPCTVQYLLLYPPLLLTAIQDGSHGFLGSLPFTRLVAQPERWQHPAVQQCKNGLGYSCWFLLRVTKVMSLYLMSSFTVGNGLVSFELCVLFNGNRTEEACLELPGAGRSIAFSNRILTPSPSLPVPTLTSEGITCRGFRFNPPTTWHQYQCAFW